MEKKRLLSNENVLQKHKNWLHMSSTLTYLQKRIKNEKHSLINY